MMGPYKGQRLRCGLTKGTQAMSGLAVTERWKERRVWLRVFIYVFATHLFAAFVTLLFLVGDPA